MKSLATIFFFAITLSAFGQTIKGVIVDDTGESLFKKGTPTIGYATVSLLDSSAAERRIIEAADKDGKFIFSDVSAGVYCINVGGLDYRDTTYRNLKITRDTTLTLSLHRAEKNKK